MTDGAQTKSQLEQETEQKVVYDESWRDLYKNTLTRAIPAHEDTHRITVCMLENFIPEEASILSVGVGTGLEAICACSMKPSWSITGFDPSEQMIQEAEEKVHTVKLQDRIHLYQGFANEIDDLIKHDAAMSFYVYHYLKTTKERVDFLKSIHRLLKPNAPFAMVYPVGKYGEEPWADQLYSAGFGYAAHRGLGTKKDFEQRLISKAAPDVAFLDHKDIYGEFQEAGFTQPQKYLQVLMGNGYLAFTQ